MTVFERFIATANSTPNGLSINSGKPMYAIAFDMDVDSLRQHYGDPYNNAYFEIRRILMRHGFTWQQGSIYFGGENINAVTCVLAAIDAYQISCPGLHPH
jgi:hypothetical protein